MDASPWRLALASAVGTSHIGTGAPCQDSAAHQIIETRDGPVLVAVVCDGAGSAAYSDVGSWQAATTFIELVSLYLDDDGRLRELDRDTAVGWIDEISEHLVATAEASGHAVRDYACTLLAAIVGPDTAAFLQIGDGAIVVSHGEEDGWSYVFWPQHGEFANTTNFVVSADATEKLEFELAPRRVDELALFSDGIENLVLHQATKTVHEAFFNAMMPPVRRARADGLDEELSKGLERYLSSAAICERTDDDKTLVLATRTLRPAIIPVDAP
jgi:hypothetical protein